MVFVSYAKFAKVLKFGTLVLLVYVVVAFEVHAPVREILTGAFIPKIRLGGGYMTALTAVSEPRSALISFSGRPLRKWRNKRTPSGEKPLKKAPGQAARQLEPMRSDTYFGMAVSNVIAYFIMLDTGALLHAHGLTHIETAIQAAQALRPVGGEFAFMLFAVGIIGTGLLAVPVLAGSAGYALAEIARWPRGLAKKLSSARAFYGTIAVVTLLGLALNLTRINPIKALFWSAVINGLCAGPIMVLVMLMTTNRTITGGLEFPKLQWLIGWISTGVMLAVAAGMLAGFAFP